MKHSEAKARQQLIINFVLAGEAAADVDNLPPPPANVDGASATTKGNQALSEGSYADAIKWYTWALQLTNPSDTNTMVMVNSKACTSAFPPASWLSSSATAVGFRTEFQRSGALDSKHRGPMNVRYTRIGGLTQYSLRGRC